MGVPYIGVGWPAIQKASKGKDCAMYFWDVRIEARKAFRTILKLDVKLSANDQVGAPKNVAWLVISPGN